MYDRTCPECGKVFAPKYIQQVCCSDRCKRERKNRLVREWNTAHGHKPRKTKVQLEIRLKTSKRQQMLANLRQCDAIAPKPKTEIIERNGIVIERRGTVPLGCHAVGLIRHNA